MKKQDHYSFIALFNYADDGISILFPDLPGCFPCADTTEEAIKNAKEALGLHLWGMESDNDEIPLPSAISDIPLDKNEVPFLVDVFMPSIREKLNNRFVKKTLSLPSWLAAKADENEVNCSKIFQNALIDYLNIEVAQKQNH